MLGCGAVHWNTENLLVATSSTKAASPSQQVPTARSSSARRGAWQRSTPALLGSWLTWSCTSICAGDQRCCEFTTATSVLDPEDEFYISPFHPPARTFSLVVTGSYLDVPSATECGVSYSQPFGQLCISSSSAAHSRKMFPQPRLRESIVYGYKSEYVEGKLMR